MHLAQGIYPNSQEFIRTNSYEYLYEFVRIPTNFGNIRVNLKTANRNLNSYEFSRMQKKHIKQEKYSEYEYGKKLNCFAKLVSLTENHRKHHIIAESFFL